MSVSIRRFYAMQFACFFCLILPLAGAQTNSDRPKAGQENKAPSPTTPAADYSGMYSFLQDGEFVQLTVEDQGRVIGFVSSYAAPEGTGGFVDRFIKSGKLDGNRLAFSTETVQGVSYEFQGTAERGEGKSRRDEAYYLLKGTLVVNTIDETKKVSSHSREIVLKSFPQDLATPQVEKK